MGKKFFKKDFKKDLKNKISDKIKFSINKKMLAHDNILMGIRY